MTMSAPLDEARLTAYALGELTEEEGKEVERVLESSAEARKSLDEIRQVARLLARGLARPAAARLSATQRAAIDAAGARPPRRSWRPVAAWGGALAAAAVVALAVLTPSLMRVRLPAVRPAPTLAAEDARRLRELELQRAALEAELKARKEVVSREASLAPEAMRQAEVRARLETLGYIDDGQPSEPVAGTDDLAAIRRPSADFNTESYDAVKDNPFIAVSQDPLSTFSVDVDTASYANVRRFLRDGQMPPAGAVRIEELVNTFDYDYAPPQDEHPFAVHLDAAVCPWAPQHQLVRVALKGRVIDRGQRPPTNLIFLIDVSGSMQPDNKLPLIKRALRLLVQALDERDRVAMVVYAGSSGLVLPSTPADQKGVLLDALHRLEAGGTTHGSEGIRLAYETARQSFIKGGANRVILATDGDFNVGVTNQDELVRLIEAKAREGVFLTVLGFGMGNLKDSTLEKLADRGNGQYAYIDDLGEARRVLVDQLTGTLVTIAKDVKIQVEFNPQRVSAYRLVGYENRVLAHQDFDDDRKDAGEIGAGHTVTAFYEVVPVGAPAVATEAPSLRYQKPRDASRQAASDEALTVRLRYKAPDGDVSTKLERTLKSGARPFAEASDDFRFASAVAAFGMILRNSPYLGSATLADTERWGKAALGRDASGQRAEFLDLVRAAATLRKGRPVQ
jgi:Ca-activated chloride channel family protein